MAKDYRVSDTEIAECLKLFRFSARGNMFEKLNPAQKMAAALLESNASRICITKARQIGMTHALAAYAYTLAKNGMRVAYVNTRNATSMSTHDIILRIDHGYGRNVKSATTTNIRFDSGGFVLMFSAHNSEVALRGHNIDVFIMDEAGFYKSSDLKSLLQNAKFCGAERIVCATTAGGESFNYLVSKTFGPEWLKATLPGSLVFSTEKLAELKGNLSDIEYAREFECFDILAAQPIIQTPFADDFRNACPPMNCGIPFWQIQPEHLGHGCGTTQFSYDRNQPSCSTVTYTSAPSAGAPTIESLLHKMNELEDDDLVQLSLLACSVLKARYGA